MKNKSVKEIKEIIDNIKFDDYINNMDRYMQYIEELKSDDRKSVRDLSKKIEKLERERLRLNSLNFYEDEGYKNGFLCIGGVDEAGRGPLAGPVVSSVVIFEKDTFIEGINDSKKLSKEKRNEIFEIIKEKAIDYGIGIVNNIDIDKFNILNATYMATKKALSQLKVKPDYLLTDALTIPSEKMVQNSIVKGDTKSISIAGASILAKVTRDNIMYEYDKTYPHYGFKNHKGYGTKEHYEALRKYGISDIHRKTFLKNLLK